MYIFQRFDVSETFLIGQFLVVAGGNLGGNASADWPQHTNHGRVVVADGNVIGCHYQECRQQEDDVFENI